ncbi:MAG: 4a-hydroxytetrahydrobiopterin dehydratase [Anaerolineae bacterium]|nr:4a-hydroxytetrahydrobiopterin dehydratase [Anaerolineae bacterium]
MVERLSESEINAQLAKMDGWARQGDEIFKTYTLTSFPAALAFVSTIGHLAEAADHHPDILLRYKKVTLTLSTHSAGGLTEKDFVLASQIDALPMKSPKI